MAEVPPEVAQAARFPISSGPVPPSWRAGSQIRRPGWTLAMSSMPSVNFVEPAGLTAAEVAEALEEVRAVLRQRGRDRSAWCVERGSELHAALTDLGLVPYDEAPIEPTDTAMALVTPPLATGNPAVTVRVAETLDDLLVHADLISEVLGLSDEDRLGARAAAAESHAWAATEPDSQTVYLASLDGRLVGEAVTLPMPHSLHLHGGSVRPEARGRGVYQRLVHARWEAAVARGTPALTVTAGAMSRPRLEILGFVPVAELVNLRDDVPR